MLPRFKEVVLGKILKKIVLSAVVLITVFASGKAQAFEVGAEADYWFTSLGGDIKSGATATTLDFNDNLNTEGYNSAGIKAYLELGDHLFSLEYTPLSYSGSGLLGNVVYRGRTFDVAQPAESGLRLNMTDLRYTYWLVNSSLGAFAKVGVTAALKSLDFAGFVDGTTTLGVAAREEASKTVTIPMVGLRAEVGLGDFAKVALSGIGVGYSGNSFIDAMAAVEISPLPFVGVALGYRLVSVKLDTDEAVLNATASGPFVGFFANF